MRVLRYELRAMGCAVRVEVVGGTAAHLTFVRERLTHLEEVWSRFLPDSDVSRLNAAGGMPVVVDPATVALLEAMVHGWQATGGAFDPTLLAPLVGLGYAGSWHEPSLATPLPAGLAPRGHVAGIAVDRDAAVARLPAGTAIDAGGIGKGLAADLVAVALCAEGAEGAMVSIGGDLRVTGRGPAGGSWRIGVADVAPPFADVATIAMTEGGAATSGTVVRSWTTEAGRRVHHLLDPENGRPVGDAAAPGGSPVVQATVIAGSAMWAEVHTKLVMVRGTQVALPELERIGLAARAVHGDGSVVTNESWQRFAADGVDAVDAVEGRLV